MALSRHRPRSGGELARASGLLQISEHSSNSSDGIIAPARTGDADPCFSAIATGQTSRLSSCPTGFGFCSRRFPACLQRPTLPVRSHTMQANSS